MTEKAKLSPETQALLEALQTLLSGRGTLSQRQEDAKREMEELHFPLAPANTIPVRVPCIHPSGYRFTAVVAPSDKYRGGRWVQIEDEQWPTDDEMCASTYPLFCDANGNWWGKRSRFRGNDFDPDTKLWLYDNVRLPILRQVGGELPIDYRIDMQPALKKIREAADKALREAEVQVAALQAGKPVDDPDDDKIQPRRKTA